VNADWFYSAGDTRQGPVTELELRRLALDGKLKPSDLVWKDGMPDWVEARTVETVFPRRSEADPDDRPSRRGRDDYDDDRPSRRGRRDDEDDEDRPRIRRTADDLDDDYDDRPRPSSRQRPGQVQAVAIMMLIGGIIGLLQMLMAAPFSGFVCCVWPGVYFEIVVGILAIVRASNMLGRDDQGPPRTLAIMQIICIINLDIINCVLGIVSLVMLNDPQVQSYYRRKGFA